MLFGLSIGMLAVSAIIILAGIGIFVSESGIGAGILIAFLTVVTFYAGYINLTQLLIYIGIYLTIGVAWAIFRLIRDTKEEFKKQKIINDKKEVFSENNSDVDFIKNKYSKYKLTDKELLSAVIDDISFHLFSYRVFFAPIDMIDYLFTDLMKDLFNKIKKVIRGYLFRTIIGKDEIETL